MSKKRNPATRPDLQSALEEGINSVQTMRPNSVDLETDRHDNKTPGLGMTKAKPKKR